MKFNAFQVPVFIGEEISKQMVWESLVFSTRQEMIKNKCVMDHVVQFVSVLSPIPKLQLTVLTIGHEWGDDPKPASSCKHCPKCHYVGMLEKV